MWDKLIGQQALINQLQTSIQQGRVSHAQLFVGDFGYGTLALVLAYINAILEEENPHIGHKVAHLNHVDLHFSFPVYSKDGDSTCQSYFPLWQKMILENPYAKEADWLLAIEAEKKQLNISSSEIEKKLAQLSLSSYEGSSKFLIIWQAEKMNTQAANKFLKFLEEPPQNTYIFLLVESDEYLLDTINSRCQKTYVKAIPSEDIKEALRKENTDAKLLDKISHQAQGNWQKALKLTKTSQLNPEFESYFIQWVRAAFQAKTKPQVLKDIVLWSRELSAWGRPKQMLFMQYATEIFRQALLQNVGNHGQVYEALSENNFNWEAFSQYIHGANIEDILVEISEASYHIERNGNAKMIFLDMGIKLTRFLHRKGT